jgi:hypothetical protein
MLEFHPGLIPDLDNVVRRGLVNGFEEGTVSAVPAQVPHGPPRATEKNTFIKGAACSHATKTLQDGFQRPVEALGLPSLRRTKGPSVTALQPIARLT